MENLKGVLPVAELAEEGDRRPVTVAGMITALRRIYTKKGQPMCFMRLEDLTGEVEVIIFSDLYERHQHELSEDRVILLSGQTDHKEEEMVKIIAKDITFLPHEPRQCCIRIDEERPLRELIDLRDLLLSCHGGMPVYLFFNRNGKLLLTGQNYWVREDENLYDKIEELFGPGCVSISAAGEKFPGLGSAGF
jgi:DNA polymerase-3 subunit alpha